MNEKDKKEARPEDTYVALRPAFWTMFYSIVLLSAAMGAGLLVFVFKRVTDSTFLLESALPWVFIALSAIFFILIAVFSGRLIITWAQLLRYARYQEERARTVIAAKDITVYAENEERRDKELRNEVQGMSEKLRESVHEAIRSSGTQTEEMIRKSVEGLNTQMYDLIRSLSDRIQSLEKSQVSYQATDAFIATKALEGIPSGRLPNVPKEPLRDNPPKAESPAPSLMNTERSESASKPDNAKRDEDASPKPEMSVTDTDGADDELIWLGEDAYRERMNALAADEREASDASEYEEAHYGRTTEETAAKLLKIQKERKRLRQRTDESKADEAPIREVKSFSLSDDEDSSFTEDADEDDDVNSEGSESGTVTV